MVGASYSQGGRGGGEPAPQIAAVVGVADGRVQLREPDRLTVDGIGGVHQPAAEEVGVEHGYSGPQRSAAVRTGASHSRSSSSSTWQSVTDAPAMSSEVT